MKKTIVAALIVLASQASADPWDSRVYVTGAVGISYMPDVELGYRNIPGSGSVSTDGVNITVGAGAGIAQKHIRNEARIDYHRGYVDDVTSGFGPGSSPEEGASIDVLTLLYTLYLQYPFLDEKMSVYAGAGMGAAYGRIPLNGSQIKEWQFAYQATGGYYWQFLGNFGVDLSYRYVAATEFEDRLYTAKWRAHEGVLALRYTFDLD